MPRSGANFSGVVLCAVFAWFHPGPATGSETALLDTFVADHCHDCHSGEDPKGDFSIENSGNLTPEDWEEILDLVATGEMPPKKHQVQPKPEEREKAIGAIMAVLTAAGKSPSLPSGPLPKDGNLVNHEQLFSGNHKGPSASPPRFWRKSQPQYDSLMEKLWVIPKLRYEKAHRRANPEWAAYSYSQPFTGLDPHNFTNYSGSVFADEAALRSLMNAGEQIAERLTAESPAYSKWIQPPTALGIPSIRRGSVWEKFKLENPKRAAEFEPFLVEGAAPTEKERTDAVERVFRIILDRPPTENEAQRYLQLLNKGVEKSGPAAAIRGLITAAVVSPEFVFRMEVGMSEPDEHGRRMLSPNELVYAIGYALADNGPDETLREAAKSGKLTTRQDVEREVRRILTDNSIEKNRILRFFQEFFGYHRAIDVFKDRGGWNLEVQYFIRDADMLVEYILKQDRDVFASLLTEDKYFVAFPHIEDPELFEEIIKFTINQTEEGIKKTKERGREIGPNKQGSYNRAWAHMNGRKLIPRTVHNDAGSKEMSYIRIYGIDGNEFEWTEKQPISVPGRRAGILTHPAWLVAHSTNFDNDVVRRGHWIREHLLAGKIPDVPIDVEAQVPEEPQSTLRERMRVTREERCIRCHQRMDPLGFPFEIYDHYGKFREKEMVGTRKNVPKEIDPSGEVFGSGDSELDGPVDDAIELVHKLAKSPRVRQSFVRHAFRYWMGRNEILADSPTIMEADKAYVENGGSFDELLVSLLTSDAFLYRK